MPIGDGPAPIVGVGRRGVRRAPGPTSLLLVVVSALLLTLVGPSTAGATSSASHAEALSATTPTLVLENQTAWVGPSQPSFDLAVRIHGGPTAVPTAQLGLAVTVYNCLSSVSGFDQSIASASPSGGELTSTPAPLPVAGLPTTADGAVSLSMPVRVGTVRTGTSPGTFTIGLTPSGGQCQAYPAGVYPVRVQLVNTTTSQVIGSFTTHLIYVDASADTEKLRVAVVLPLHATVGPATAPTTGALLRHPSAALDPPSAAAMTGVTSTVEAIGRHPAVAITTEAFPQTVASLDSVGATRSTVTQLAGLASTSSVHQFVWAPYTPVNASNLVAAGLADELRLQVSRGSVVLSEFVTHTPPVPASGATSGPLGAWVAADSLNTDTAAQLQSQGYGQLVLPAGSVSSAPTNGSATEPFQVTTGRGSPMTAVAASADLAARFTSAPGNPVLAAHQLVAELAQIYYEKPNDTTLRGTVAMPPASWTDDPQFVDALLGSLDGNPILQAVTTSQLFATLPTASCRTGCRLTGTSATGDLPTAAIRHQRQQVQGFSSAASGTLARSLATQMGDVVLAGESEALRPADQAMVLHNTGLAVAAQLGQLTVGGDRTVTLTSRQGTLQVTIVSTAPYPVTAILTLTSDKLLFPNGTTQWSKPTQLLPAVTGSGHTTVVPVAVRTRASGVFAVTIVMHSPVGGLELAGGQVSVRSTATSVVGIVLSVGALAVLAVWWVRTSLRRRRQRREERVDGPAPVVG